MENCIICSSDKIVQIRKYKGKSNLFQNKALVKCGNCELVFASPMPEESDLQIYNSEYFESAHGGHPKKPNAIAYFSGINKLRCEYVSRILEKMDFSAINVLEIGPGQGYFANHWLSKNSNTNYYGVETDLTCHKALKEIGVKILLPEQVDSSIDEVDLVIMSHVLEHVSDPIGFLQIITRKLKKGGALFIEVPCNDWEHKDFDEPHLLFFNKNSIKYTLQTLGFDKIHVNYYGQTIKKLRSKLKYEEIFLLIKIKLIDFGFYHLFSYNSNKELAILKPIERASVKSFLAHKESIQPAWWVRAVSFKL
jgi:2-polyprenyl-3-methyl-5-hydroxy-6-metoxy-1,4-benzoquinol methylase